MPRFDDRLPPRGPDGDDFQRFVWRQNAILRARQLCEPLVWTTAFVLSLAQWAHTLYFFEHDVIRAVQAEAFVLQGYGPWRVFQSRVLGPWTEKAIAYVFGTSLGVAHIALAVVLLTIAAVVMFYAGRAVAGRQGGWSAMLAFELVFVLTQARPWLYIWDYYILLAGAIFMLLAVRRAPWWQFLLLMGVDSLNHESAIFISLYMVATALADTKAYTRRLDLRMLGGGVFGGLTVIAVTETMRSLLLKQQIGWKIYSDVGPRPTNRLEGFYYFHLQLPANLHDIYNWYFHPNVYFTFIKPMPLVVTLVIAVLLVRRHGWKAAGLAAYGVVEILALLGFALTAETRTMLELAPFLCLGGMLATKSDWPGAGMSAYPPPDTG